MIQILKRWQPDSLGCVAASHFTWPPVKPSLLPFSAKFLKPDGCRGPQGSWDYRADCPSPGETVATALTSLSNKLKATAMGHLSSAQGNETPVCRRWTRHHPSSLSGMDTWGLNTYPHPHFQLSLPAFCLIFSRAPFSETRCLDWTQGTEAGERGDRQPEVAEGVQWLEEASSLAAAPARGPSRPPPRRPGPLGLGGKPAAAAGFPLH